MGICRGYVGHMWLWFTGLYVSSLLTTCQKLTTASSYITNNTSTAICWQLLFSGKLWISHILYYYVESPLVFQIRLTDSQVKLCWENSLQLKVVLLLENFSPNADNLHPGLIFKASKDTYILEYPPDNKLPNKRFKL